MLVRLPKNAKPQRFGGFGLVLQPGDNQISEPRAKDKKLQILLERGERRGLWEINPKEEKPVPNKATRQAKKAAKKTAKKTDS